MRGTIYNTVGYSHSRSLSSLSGLDLCSSLHYIHSPGLSLAAVAIERERERDREGPTASASFLVLALLTFHRNAHFLYSQTYIL
jgi:hypothetical protein